MSVPVSWVQDADVAVVDEDGDFGAALLGYARQGDAIVVVGIDRLGRNADES
jgi:DNA invertase Pin-like site-specific DNA recombinase